MTTRRRTPEAAARRARVVELRRAHWPWADIGVDLGITAQGAQQLYSAALAEAPVAQLEEHRAEELLLVDAATRALLTLAWDRDVPARTRIEAWSTIRAWAERKAKLLGLDASTKVSASILSTAQIDN